MQLRRQPDDNLKAAVAKTVGEFLLTLSSLEMDLDDLMGLASSRFDVRSNISKKYPVFLNTKLQALPVLAEMVGLPWPKEKFERVSTLLKNNRNWVSHGKIVSVSGDTDSFAIKILKREIRKEGDGRKTEMMSRNYMEISKADLQGMMTAMAWIAELVEDLRAKVFVSGDGWPSYYYQVEVGTFSARRFRIRSNTRFVGGI